MICFTPEPLSVALSVTLSPLEFTQIGVPSAPAGLTTALVMVSVPRLAEKGRLKKLSKQELERELAVRKNQEIPLPKRNPLF